MSFGKTKSSRRLFGNSTTNFLRGQPRPVVWRLEVREDTNDRGMFLSHSTGRFSRSTSARLGSFISAGGMRTLRPGRYADLNARRRQFVIRLSLLLLTFWLIFLFVPCE